MTKEQRRNNYLDYLKSFYEAAGRPFTEATRQHFYGMDLRLLKGVVLSYVGVYTQLNEARDELSAFIREFDDNLAPE